MSHYERPKFAALANQGNTAADTLTAARVGPLKPGVYRIHATVPVYVLQGDSTVTAASATSPIVLADVVEDFLVESFAEVNGSDAYLSWLATSTNGTVRVFKRGEAP